LEKSLSVETVLLGGRKDIPQAQALATVGLNACGIFSLEESAALLQACSLAVCVDSGPMHVAGALGVPLVIVFSRMNTQLARWFPLGDNYTILYREVSCAGCRLQNCTVEGHPCIADITLEQIASAVSAKLSGLPILPGCLADTLALQADPVSQPRPHPTAGPVCSTR
jgi:ADP-heptose:LPS heptosyltransferase